MSNSSKSVANASTKAAAAGVASLAKNQPPKAPKPEDTRSHDQIKKDVVKNRQDLAETLDAIEYKLNVPKQARFALQRVNSRVMALRKDNPGVLVGAAVASAALAGAGIFFGVRAVIRR